MSELGKLFSSVLQHRVHRRSRPVSRGRGADACVAATDMIAQPRRPGRRVTEVSTCPLRSRRHPEQTALYEVVRQHLKTQVALVGEDGWDRHGAPTTANLQILRYVLCGILDDGGACSQWLDSVHSSAVGSWPGSAHRLRSSQDGRDPVRLSRSATGSWHGPHWSGLARLARFGAERTALAPTHPLIRKRRGASRRTQRHKRLARDPRVSPSAYSVVPEPARAPTTWTGAGSPRLRRRATMLPRPPSPAWPGTRPHRPARTGRAGCPPRWA